MKELAGCGAVRAGAERVCVCGEREGDLEIEQLARVE